MQWLRSSRTKAVTAGSFSRSDRSRGRVKSKLRSHIKGLQGIIPLDHRDFGTVELVDCQTGFGLDGIFLGTLMASVRQRSCRRRALTIGFEWEKVKGDCGSTLTKSQDLRRHFIGAISPLSPVTVAARGIGSHFWLSDAPHPRQPSCLPLTPHLPPPTSLLQTLLLLPSSLRLLLSYSWCFSILLLASAIIFLWPSNPELSVVLLRLNQFRVTPLPSISIHIAMGLEIKIRIPDFFAINYSLIVSSIFYRGELLGSATSAGGRIEARKVPPFLALKFLSSIPSRLSLAHLLLPSCCSRRSSGIDVSCTVEDGSFVRLNKGHIVTKSVKKKREEMANVLRKMRSAGVFEKKSEEFLRHAVGAYVLAFRELIINLFCLLRIFELTVCYSISYQSLSFTQPHTIPSPHAVTQVFNLKPNSRLRFPSACSLQVATSNISKGPMILKRYNKREKNDSFSYTCISKWKLIELGFGSPPACLPEPWTVDFLINGPDSAVPRFSSDRGLDPAVQFVVRRDQGR
ncbi:hypothetical protein IEQ34_019821 [Dendrobium chrysotoxum]|uniref:Uncharacterized protein n=1 Tax=Dendrobium chrysotoxum TaxID=161865 RepID=A0AAV7GAH2_DENCH|nr:hypothetical protein IEQ34_019821 [Dendrobium chrysotoxum]